MLKSYLCGNITYEQWVDNDVRLLKEAGATKAKILDAIKTLRPMNGAIDVLRQLRFRNYKIFVISGSMDLVIEAIFPDDMNLFDKVFINHYLFNDDGIITHAISTKYDMEQKATCIIDTAKEYGVQPKDCTFVGDNVNDVEAALVVGLSIAFNAKSDELVQVATYHVETSNLRDILKYLD